MAQRSPSLRELVFLGSTIVGCIVGGLVIGLLIDHFAGSSPVGVVVGTLAGIAVAALAMYVQMRNFLNDS